MELGYIPLYRDKVDGSLNMELGKIDSIAYMDGAGGRLYIFYCIGMRWMVAYILLYWDEGDGSLNMELGAIYSIV